MSKLSCLTSLVTLALVGRTYAAIGPVTDLTISNAAVSPDGFTRDAVVVNGVFPGPLITGKKVSWPLPGFTEVSFAHDVPGVG